MVFDAHERAFAFFQGACQRGIYDNMKTAVDTVFVGKDRQYNRRFLQMCSHHLVEPVACTPAAGWEKGQVENQVGARSRALLHAAAEGQELRRAERLAPRQMCRLGQGARPSRAEPERTIWEVFEEERPKLIPYRGRFDGFHALPASVSKTCLVRFDNNRYSVSASAVGRPVDIHAYADRIVIRQDGRIVAEHPRALRPWRDESTIPGITCRCWRASPAPCATARRSRTGCCRRRWTVSGASSPVPNDGDRQMVKILAAVLSDGLPAVEAACAPGACRGRPFVRRHPQHSLPTPRSRSERQPSPRRKALQTAAMRLSPTAPATTP